MKKIETAKQLRGKVKEDREKQKICYRYGIGSCYVEPITCAAANSQLITYYLLCIQTTVVQRDVQQQKELLVLFVIKNDSHETQLLVDGILQHSLARRLVGCCNTHHIYTESIVNALYSFHLVARQVEGLTQSVVVHFHLVSLYVLYLVQILILCECHSHAQHSYNG